MNGSELARPLPREKTPDPFFVRPTGVKPFGVAYTCFRRKLRHLPTPGKAVRRQAVEPTHEDGRRWPVPKTDPPRTAWRLMVSYWRIATAQRPLETPQARKARRAAQALDAEALRAIAQAPMRPVEPQQPLDIGLFEVRLPEAPHIVVPDE